MMSNAQPLPFSGEFTNADDYVESLLRLLASEELLRTLCGGVHILDFFTSTPALYDRVLPDAWRDYFAKHEVMKILDLLLRQDISSDNAELETQNPKQLPPESLLAYIGMVRKHLLTRAPRSSQCARNRALRPTQKLARHVAVGMTVKKIHEVGLFASFIDDLCTKVKASSHTPITHLVDFGSGQNYLGRALASEPYNKKIIAIESKEANAQRAKEFDVMARLATKAKVMRNKKAFRAGLGADGYGLEAQASVSQTSVTPDSQQRQTLDSQLDTGSSVHPPNDQKMNYVDHLIQDGDLSDVVSKVSNSSGTEMNLMVMSLHSCGNLVHHGLRSMILNPEVKVVAMVGCCYNLVTERLGPATYKLPELRPTTYDHPRLESTGQVCDPHGFPMSTKFCEYQYISPPSAGGHTIEQSKGIRLNITARMMAVQAPANWGTIDSEAFFTRHFYRALLQRVFLDRGVVGPPTPECVGGFSPAGHTSSGGTPIVIGSLRKSCYSTFSTYVRAALAKLFMDPDRGDLFRSKMEGITDEELCKYEDSYKEGKKNLSIMWSLMAFSAGVIEAAIVVDRWLWLREQDDVGQAWVEPLFDYSISPRNLVVVGVRKSDAS